MRDTRRSRTKTKLVTSSHSAMDKVTGPFSWPEEEGPMEGGLEPLAMASAQRRANPVVVAYMSRVRRGALRVALDETGRGRRGIRNTI